MSTMGARNLKESAKVSCRELVRCDIKPRPVFLINPKLLSQQAHRAVDDVMTRERFAAGVTGV